MSVGKTEGRSAHRECRGRLSAWPGVTIALVATIGCCHAGLTKRVATGAPPPLNLVAREQEPKIDWNGILIHPVFTGPPFPDTEAVCGGFPDPAGVPDGLPVCVQEASPAVTEDRPEGF